MKKGNWETLIGSLCYNIWNNTNEYFNQSKDYKDMEWPFLCGLYVFHNWDNSILSKKHSIAELLPSINPSVLDFKDHLIAALPTISSKMNIMKATRKSQSQSTIEPSKIFISFFTESLITGYGTDIDKVNPMDFLQFGLEVLLLFTIDIKEKHSEFYNLIEDIGPGWEEDAQDVLEQITMAFE